MSLDQATSREPDDVVLDTVDTTNAPKRLASWFVGDAAAGFDASALTAVHESRMQLGDIVVHAAILDHAHVVRVLDRGCVRFVELFGFTGIDGKPTRRVQYNNKHGLDLEIFDPSGLTIRARIRSSIGRVGGWRGVTHPGDRAHALALAHCRSTCPSAPRTVVGVTADFTQVRIDAVHEYEARGAIKVIACETTLRLSTARGE